MAKKPKDTSIVANTNNVIKTDSSVYLNDTSLEYAMSTLDRAIPGIDGLKNSQRKAIFVLSKLSGETKTISVAGKMISDGIYLHGDASAAGTLSMLASTYHNNYPLIGHRGGFGTPVDPSPASPRYTYVKKSKNTEALVLCDKDVVPMQENYDATTVEPKYFLPIIPLALFGTQGLAVGYSSTILPHKITDIIDNCINAIKGKSQKVMIPYFKSYGCNDRVDCTDVNKYTVYGKAEVIDGSTVKITGLPNKITLEKFVEKLIKMEEEGKVRDYDDDSSEMVEITVKLPRGTSAGWEEMDVLNYFDLNSKWTQSLVVLGENGKVKVYDTTESLIIDFVEFRLKYYKKRYEKLLKDCEDELKIRNLIKACFEDNITTKIKPMKNRQEVYQYIKAVNIPIGAHDDAVNNITNYALHRWTIENYEQVKEDIKNINEEIVLYTGILGSPEALKEIYISELQELRKMKF